MGDMRDESGSSASADPMGDSAAPDAAAENAGRNPHGSGVAPVQVEEITKEKASGGSDVQEV